MKLFAGLMAFIVLCSCEVVSATAQTPTVQLISPKLIEVYQETHWAEGQIDWLATELNQATNTASYMVEINGQIAQVSQVGIKRRPTSAALKTWNLKVGTSVFLTTALPIAENANITVTVQVPGFLQGEFSSTSSMDRTNPAIHVSYAGYDTTMPKRAMVGYYLGTLGEMPAPAGEFYIIDSPSGTQVFQGQLHARPDAGFKYPIYQQVVEADFDSLQTPGTYQVYIPGYGCSIPFRIGDDFGALLARTYEQGLFQQRCGYAVELPYSRFAHAACHTHMASKIDATMVNAQEMLASAGAGTVVEAPSTELTNSSQSYFPYCNLDPVDVVGGHHDAGDYSKYLPSSVSVAHCLMTAVDAFPGVNQLDNLGIPESADGIPDVLQEAKWELDFILKMQDSDGGFFYRVYPQNRAYELDCLPEDGDSQIVFPKNTYGTAGAVAALAQAASSLTMKHYYPQAAAAYLAASLKGWQFLQNAFTKYGEAGSYQQIGGTTWGYKDNLAWAYAELYLATTNTLFQTKLEAIYTPSNTATWQWGWWRMNGGYGRAARAYGLAEVSGKMDKQHLDPTYLALCQNEITGWADTEAGYASQMAYGSSFPTPSKWNGGAGWYFSSDQAFDIAVGMLLKNDSNYWNALASNLAYETGCNPRNQSYVTGIGPTPYHNLLNQYAENSARQDDPSGLPVGNLQSGFPYLGTYQSLLGQLCYPGDAPTTNGFPLYDRGGDTPNALMEQVGTDQAKALATAALIMATSGKINQPWTNPPSYVLINPSANCSLAASITNSVSANITPHWEGFGDQESDEFDFQMYTPLTGNQWVEAEFTTADGRRLFATNAFAATAPLIAGVPTVTITTLSPQAIWNSTNGVIRICRSNTNGTTTVAFALNGASNGSDFNWLAGTAYSDYYGTAVLPNGSNHVDLTISAKQRPYDFSTRTLTLTLLPGNYNTAYPGTASVQIIRNNPILNAGIPAYTAPFPNPQAGVVVPSSVSAAANAADLLDGYPFSESYSVTNSSSARSIFPSLTLAQSYVTTGYLVCTNLNSQATATIQLPITTNSSGLIIEGDLYVKSYLAYGNRNASIINLSQTSTCLMQLCQGEWATNVIVLGGRGAAITATTVAPAYLTPNAWHKLTLQLDRWGYVIYIDGVPRTAVASTDLTLWGKKATSLQMGQFNGAIHGLTIKTY